MPVTEGRYANNHFQLISVHIDIFTDRILQYLITRSIFPNRAEAIRYYLRKGLAEEFPDVYGLFIQED